MIAYQPKRELLSREVSFISVWPFVCNKNNRYNSHQWLHSYCVPGPVKFIFYSKAGCFSAVFWCSPIWNSNKMRRSVASLGFSYWDLVAQLSPDLLGSWTKVLFTWFWFWITPRVGYVAWSHPITWRQDSCSGSWAPGRCVIWPPAPHFKPWNSTHSLPCTRQPGSSRRLVK